ncbi:MAG: replication initiation protein [Cetobacterium sp.]|nr:replication initiation protein [Cetobacterium sp.]
MIEINILSNITLKGNNLSSYGRKLLNYIYSEGIKFYKKNKHYEIYQINISKLNKTLDKNQLKEELIKIQNLQIETINADNTYTYFTILNGFTIIDSENLKVALSPFLLEFIFSKNTPYKNLNNIMDFKNLKSKYSKIILDIYKRTENIPKMDIKEFQKLFKYSEKYRNNDIKKYVLEQAKRELEKHSNLNLTWEIELLGRKWNYIKLNILPMKKIEEGENGENFNSKK